MDKEKIYIDLSKCTEEERKSLPQIIKNGGDEVPFQMVGDFYNKDFPYLCFLTHLNYPIWDCCRNAFDLTELTYPEFIKLFEGGEGENKCCENPDIQWNKIEISIGDKQGSYKDLNFNFCDNCGETFNEAFD